MKYSVLAIVATVPSLSDKRVSAFSSSPTFPNISSIRQCQKKKGSTYLSLSDNKYNDNTTNNEEDSRASSYAAEERRKFLSSAAALGVAFLGASTAKVANAGIDLSGISPSSQQQGGGGGNSLILEQLRSGGYDGSASLRMDQIRQAAASESSSNKSNNKPTTTMQPVIEDEGNAAVNVYVSNSREKKIGLLKTRFDAEILQGGGGGRSRYTNLSFEFPSDWLQLDRSLGGIQFVDQRNGDKLYVLEAALPEGKSLAETNKSFFGEAIFGDSRGAIPRAGNTIDEYKVSYAKVISDCPQDMCITRKRALVKYATVTGNGYRVERRALVDAYEVGSKAIMMVTSSNAVKFDAKGPERDTVEAIVDSFRVDA